ncbi:transposon Tf2-6 polyprotein [Nephila pilipes]|uniref:Transposon Tf2-6 polyprotein n=1 Tax=Nephila pilipes TaxID=299642 RepID=A0A8X6TTN3_NEPPI|nr:transposon Tf2-6 polyprotein [Nephila pilipes]
MHVITKCQRHCLPLTYLLLWLWQFRVYKGEMSEMFIKERGASVNAIQMFTCVTSPVTLLDIEVHEATGTVGADIGASGSVGGELIFKFLKNRGQKFIELYLSMYLVDDQQSTLLV